MKNLEVEFYAWIRKREIAVSSSLLEMQKAIG
jgi:hypothetical protein